MANTCRHGASSLGCVTCMQMALNQSPMRVDAPSPARMTISGTFRLHFNRHGAAPLVWCIATEDWELAISSFTVKVPLRSVYRAKATPDDEDGKPSAWLEATGTLVVRASHAEITA